MGTKVKNEIEKYQIGIFLILYFFMGRGGGVMEPPVHPNKQFSRF
jgi:hypothetical protein